MIKWSIKYDTIYARLVGNFFMMDTIAKPTEARKWVVAGYFTLGYGTLVAWYLTQVAGVSLAEPSFWLSFLAATAGFMLATSFSASSFSYFFSWPDMRKGYQKQIGVMAFWLCFVYCVGLLVVEPDIYYYGFWENLATPNFILGLSAMTIFGLMVAINSGPIAPYFSWDTIRLFLNLGFLGYGFLVMRAILLEWPLWVEWMTTFSGLPTNRFILSVLAISVLLLRLAVIIHRRSRPAS